MKKHKLFILLLLVGSVVWALVRWLGGGSSRILKDANFSYDLNASSEAFKLKNKQATLQELNVFTYEVCWLGYLYPKLQQKAMLTDPEAQLLRLCFQVQLSMMDTFASVALEDMIRFPVENGYLQGIDNLDVLRDNFTHSMGELRVLMRRWADVYQFVPGRMIKQIFEEIEKEVDSFITQDGSRFKSGSWKNVLSVAKNASLPNEQEENAMRMCTDIDKVLMDWLQMKANMDKMIQGLLSMRQGLNDIRSSSLVRDSGTLKKIQDVLFETTNVSHEILRRLGYVFYDLPVALFTYRASGSLKKSLGWFKDDNVRATQTMMDYCRLLSKSKALSFIRTKYVVNGYMSLVNQFEDRLSPEDFRSFCRQWPLYRVELQNGAIGQAHNILHPLCTIQYNFPNGLGLYKAP